ncbi:MAG: phytanoyl-CoA dioxygenase family protein, partial [Thiohalomonadales bacterium]
LDDAAESNGCLKVILKSHELGILNQKEIEKITIQKPYLCEVQKGDMVIMKPLTLHSSSKSVKPRHRRVVHIEYSNYNLPAHVSWA